MRKYTFLILIILILNIITPISAEAVSFVPPIDVYSEAVYMLNLDTDTVVFAKNEDKLMSPASLTKIMTAGLVLEHFKDNINELKTTYVSAPSTAFDELYLSGASNADFRIGELANYNDLLYGLMLRSACEAANIIAFNFGDGDMQNFVKKMNEKAIELGATNTNFTNAHGLYDEKQRTTARDMAIITEWAMSQPLFMDISNTVNYDLEPTNKHAESRTVAHTNLMIDSRSPYFYPYIKGIKTGTLDESGRCLVTTATKDGYSYLLVTLNAPLYNEKNEAVFYNFIDHKNLYDWAFSKLSNQNLLNKDEEVAQMVVEYGKNADHVLLKPNASFSSLWSSDINEDNIKKSPVKFKESVVAPVREGDIFGYIELSYNGEIITKIDLVASSSVERDEFKYKLGVAKQFTSSKMFKIAIFVSGGILLIYLVLFEIYKSKRRRRTTFARKKAKR